MVLLIESQDGVDWHPATVERPSWEQQKQVTLNHTRAHTTVAGCTELTISHQDICWVLQLAQLPVSPTCTNEVVNKMFDAGKV